MMDIQRWLIQLRDQGSDHIITAITAILAFLSLITIIGTACWTIYTFWKRGRAKPTDGTPELLQLRFENERIRQDHQSMESKLARAETALAHLQQQSQRFQVENAALEAENKSAAEKLSHLSHQLEVQKKELDQARHEVQRVTGDLVQQARSLPGSLGEKAALERQIKLLESTLATTEEMRKRTYQASCNLGQQFQAAKKHEQELLTKIGALLADLEQAQITKQQLNAQIEDYAGRYAESLEKSDRLQNEKSRLLRQQQKQLTQGGKIWDRPVAPDAPRFRPMSVRKARIIAIAYFKGGVGKTTITANLGAFLASQGKKVLLLDLDSQESLSMRCLSQEEKRDVDDHDRHLEKYLRRRNINPPEFLQTTVIRVDSTKVESLYLAACSSRLQYVDSELMGLWGVDESSPDVRMLLRGTLHSPSIADKFDYILMDCPPRLSTAFVNALFACDGVLIPTILDVVSAQGVPHFLHSLKQLRLACPTLQVLGLLANRVQTISSAPVMSEADWLRWLPKKIRDAWGEPIQLFGTYVKRESALAHPNPKQMFASLDSGFQATFLDLEKELRDRIRAIQAPVSV